MAKKDKADTPAKAAKAPERLGNGRFVDPKTGKKNLRPPR